MKASKVLLTCVYTLVAILTAVILAAPPGDPFPPSSLLPDSTWSGQNYSTFPRDIANTLKERSPLKYCIPKWICRITFGIECGCRDNGIKPKWEPCKERPDSICCKKPRTKSCQYEDDPKPKKQPVDEKGWPIWDPCKHKPNKICCKDPLSKECRESKKTFPKPNGTVTGVGSSTSSGVRIS